jgi:hypothetical protein
MRPHDRFPRRKVLAAVGFALATAGLAPLRSDGGQAECCNAASSLASTVNNPTAGDEQFFTLPVGPANVMMLLDASGSMGALPQCGDGYATWNDSSPLTTCAWPAALAIPASAGVSGTCNVTADANLSWMHGYTPTATLVDPGRGVATYTTPPVVTAATLTDTPSWGTGCAGDNCLFRADRIYSYGTWEETRAVPYPDCRLRRDAEGDSPGTTYYDSPSPTGAVVTDQTGADVGPAATTGVDQDCMRCLFGDSTTPARGFYFYSFRYTTATGTSRTGRVVLFSGGWLNANPPKFMSARKVIKDTVWIDPARPSNTDLARFGLSYYTTALTDRAAVIVPLGPSRSNTYPTNWTRMVEARQLILDAINHSWPGGVTLPALANGATPTASALFRMGQYFSSPNYYTARFGSSYELAAFRESTAGRMLAPWAGSADQKSICWGCQ